MNVETSSFLEAHKDEHTADSGSNSTAGNGSERFKRGQEWRKQQQQQFQSSSVSSKSAIARRVLTILQAAKGIPKRVGWPPGRIAPYHKLSGFQHVTCPASAF